MGLLATVDFWGVQKHVRLELIDEPVEPGDYVLNHVGFAIRRIPPEDIAETLAMYDELAAGAGRRRPHGGRRARRGGRGHRAGDDAGESTR
jgi:hydrogenase expression/formation protein HypC